MFQELWRKTSPVLEKLVTCITFIKNTELLLSDLATLSDDN